MKNLEELGISPTPWVLKNKSNRTIWNGANFILTTVIAQQDARLISAAPDLYECLREAVVESCVSYCGEHPIVCKKKDGECFVQKWRSALAKASGDNVDKDETKE